jgi:hypothetical protein
MKKQPQRLQLKKETLGPLASGRGIGVDVVKNTAEDCTSPLCMETTCPRTCGCDGVATALEEHIARP